MIFTAVEICGDFLLSSDSREEVGEVERSCVLVRPWPNHKHHTNPKASSFCLHFSQVLKFLDFSKINTKTTIFIYTNLDWQKSWLQLKFFSLMTIFLLHNKQNYRNGEYDKTRLFRTWKLPQENQRFV
jgi:hypothetical protein